MNRPVRNPDVHRIRPQSGAFADLAGRIPPVAAQEDPIVNLVRLALDEPEELCNAVESVVPVDDGPDLFFRQFAEGLVDVNSRFRGNSQQVVRQSGQLIVGS